MKGNCRKVTAALLSCILIFLSFAAEFSHTHNLPARGASSAQTELGGRDDGKSALTHNYNCVACQFAATHFAVVVSAAIELAVAPATLLSPAAPVTVSQFFFQLSSLRAPPAVLA